MQTTPRMRLQRAVERAEDAWRAAMVVGTDERLRRYRKLLDAQERLRDYDAAEAARKEEG